MISEERVVTHKAPKFPGYWTASQLGCWRRMYLLAKEHEGDFVESPVLSEGRLHEDDVIAKLRVKGVTVTGRQTELKHPTLPLRGHPDGWATVSGNEGLYIPPGHYLLDVKSMDRPFYSKAIKDFIGNFPHLYYQLQGYSLMSKGEEIYVPIKNRATGEIYELVLQPDEAIWRIIELGVSQVAKAVDTPGFDYKTLACPDPDSIAARYCPYKERELCQYQTNILEVTEAEVVQAISEYEEGKSLERSAARIKDDAKLIIIAWLKKNGVKKIRVGDSVPTLTEGSRRNCNFDLLKKDYPEAHRQAISETVYEKFQIY